MNDDQIGTDADQQQTARRVETEPVWMSLASYRSGYDAGRPAVVRVLWYLVSLLVFEPGWCPVSAPKRLLLRLFGATIGRNVVIKPHVRIKFPWRLSVGDHSWIGEEAWIDNLAQVTIGRDVCISQGVYLCTGSHDPRRTTFDLIVQPIVVEDQAWLAARSVVLPGVTIGRGAVIAAGSTVPRDVAAGIVAGGCPAKPLKPRSDS